MDDTASIRVFLAGDVMLARGIDQVLAHPGDPQLYERSVRDAREYVALAEAKNGPIPAPVGFDYVWGDALGALAAAAPDARIVNLETAITQSLQPAPKSINYKMHPANLPVLSAAGVDCCSLANNHVLDWGEAGLLETLATLEGAGIGFAGAGRDAETAARPAIIELAGGARVIVLGFGHSSSGVPAQWAAGPARPGVAFVPDLDDATARRIGERVRAVKRAGDIVVASVHWGPNWGYEIADAERRFAHALVDAAGVDIVHGHSSHHPRPIEVHEGKLILYGCGDFINDYEGISGYEEYRGDLAAMYLPRLEAAGGRLVDLELVPLRMAKFRLNRATPAEADWLADTLTRESARFGVSFQPGDGGALRARWPGGAGERRR